MDAILQFFQDIFAYIDKEVWLQVTLLVLFAMASFLYIDYATGYIQQHFGTITDKAHSYTPSRWQPMVVGKVTSMIFIPESHSWTLYVNMPDGSATDVSVSEDYYRKKNKGDQLMFKRSYGKYTNWCYSTFELQDFVAQS